MYISKRELLNEQFSICNIRFLGALFSAVSWVNTFTVLLNNVYQNALYSATVAIWRGFVWIVATGMVTLASILLT